MEKKAYQKEVDAIYGRKSDLKIRKTPEPYRVFHGPNKGTYSCIVVSRMLKNERVVERHEYLSAYLTSHLIRFFSNPQDLKPVTDNSHPKYEDTLEYDNKNRTFCIQRYIFSSGNTKTLVVFTSKLQTPIVPGSVKDLYRGERKGFHKMNRKDRRRNDEQDEQDEQDDQDYQDDQEDGHYDQDYQDDQDDQGKEISQKPAKVEKKEKRQSSTEEEDLDQY